jgi:hypothetical protein
MLSRMSLDPDQRLEALRREIEQESPRPVAPSPQPPPPPAANLAPARDAAAVAALQPSATVPSTTTATTANGSGSEARPGDGWSLSDVTDAIFEGGVAHWIGIGLVVVGIYLVLALFFPGIEFFGSLLILVAGVGLLWAHFTHRAPGWALYAGALLAGIGALRVIGDLVPFEADGMTSIGVGLGFLGIGYLRRTQAGGWGWQGILGAVALAFGLFQFAVGLLPGDAGMIDVIIPIVLLGLGALILVRMSARQRATA